MRNCDVEGADKSSEEAADDQWEDVDEEVSKDEPSEENLDAEHREESTGRDGCNRSFLGPK